MLSWVLGPRKCPSLSRICRAKSGETMRDSNYFILFRVPFLILASGTVKGRQDSNNCSEGYYTLKMFCIGRQPLVGLPAVKRSMLHVCQRTFEYWVWWTVAVWCAIPCRTSDISKIFNTWMIPCSLAKNSAKISVEISCQWLSWNDGNEATEV